jgi:hypothetical protein
MKKRMDTYFNSRQYRQVLKAFSRYSDKITPSQKKIVNKYWGSDQIKSKKELKNIINLTEKYYREEKLKN